MTQKQRWDKYNKSKLGVISRMYRGQCSTSKRRGHDKPSYSFDELKSFLLNSDTFNKLYTNWITSNYNKWVKPSLDRLDDNKGYSFNNIQLMTWKENFDKASKCTSEGKFKHGGGGKKQVSMFSKDGVLLKTFESAVEANRVTKVNIGNLNRCCNNHIKYAGGFIWKFSNEKELQCAS